MGVRSSKLPTNFNRADRLPITDPDYRYPLSVNSYQLIVGACLGCAPRSNCLRTSIEPTDYLITDHRLPITRLPITPLPPPTSLHSPTPTSYPPFPPVQYRRFPRYSHKKTFKWTFRQKIETNLPTSVTAIIAAGLSQG